MNSADLYAQIATRGAVAELPRAKFRLTGADRLRYLNGQVSNDVRKLTPAAAMQACVMTAKGKMSADIFISAAADWLLVDAEPSLRETLAARFEKYIISDDVTLEDVTDDLTLVHIIGTLPPAFSAGDTPARTSRRYGRPGLDILVKSDEVSAAIAQLSQHLVPIDDAMLETLRIEAGIPRWGFELGEDTIPVEAGLDRTAIDYHKGCYIGQEVISRLKSIGHVNRHLHGFISTSGAPLEPGMRLFTPADPAREIGRLTSAAYSFALEKPVALGYLKRGTVADTLEARPANETGGGTACPVTVKELPIIP